MYQYLAQVTSEKETASLWIISILAVLLAFCVGGAFLITAVCQYFYTKIRGKALNGKAKTVVFIVVLVAGFVLPIAYFAYEYSKPPQERFSHASNDLG